MADSTAHPTLPFSTTPLVDPTDQASAWMSELGTLLAELETAAAPRGTGAVLGPQADNQLAQVRLGVAGSLYTTLRMRHAGMAAHGLRVALGSSAFAAWLGVEPAQRDLIEVAALLHDVGMIGLPDQVLLKPGPLTADEAFFVERSRKSTVEILRAAAADPALLELVEHVPAWFDGSWGGGRLAGAEIPCGARVIALVEAFDSMTTDHVFRPAVSHERAVRELFEFAGTQFDPALVPKYAEFLAQDQTAVRREVAMRWLRELDPEVVNSSWELSPLPARTPQPDTDALFQQKLLDNMHDGVVFVDAGMMITLWNHGAERLTGIAAAGVCQRHWSPTLLSLRNERGELIAADDCPVISSIRSGVQSLRRLSVTGRNGHAVLVDSHAIAVLGPRGEPLGAVLLLHDASEEVSLEERCQNLHEKATKDPMTQVANRAEFDRVHEMFIQHHRQRQAPCSLIICDLDRFKQVNDVYGHQAGDDAIRSLAALMKSCCRAGDLAARYGGEEFVMLCADCDNAAAARRAEQIRKLLANTPQAKLDGRAITASFGVTEIQPGDTPETMLRRADRALLMAKDKGRNTVVQLGAGSSREAAEPRRGFWPWSAGGQAMLLEQVLSTPVPIRVAVEKLRGFVADHCAKLVSIDANHVNLQIDDGHPTRLRRRTDRPVSFSMDLRFEEEQPERGTAPVGAGRAASRTRIHVSITPSRTRDRRRADIDNRAREVLASFRSYLMAAEIETPRHREGVLRRASWILTPWFAKG